MSRLTYCAAGVRPPCERSASCRGGGTSAIRMRGVGRPRPLGRRSSGSGGWPTCLPRVCRALRGPVVTKIGCCHRRRAVSRTETRHRKPPGDPRAGGGSTAKEWLGRESIAITHRYLHLLGTGADASGLSRLNEPRGYAGVRGGDRRRRTGLSDVPPCGCLCRSAVVVQVVELRGFELLTFSDGRATSKPRRD